MMWPAINTGLRKFGDSFWISRSIWAWDPSLRATAIPIKVSQIKAYLATSEDQAMEYPNTNLEIILAKTTGVRMIMLTRQMFFATTQAPLESDVKNLFIILTTVSQRPGKRFPGRWF